MSPLLCVGVLSPKFFKITHFPAYSQNLSSWRTRGGCDKMQIRSDSEIKKIDKHFFLWLREISRCKQWSESRLGSTWNTSFFLTRLIEIMILDAKFAINYKIINYWIAFINVVPLTKVREFFTSSSRDVKINTNSTKNGVEHDFHKIPFWTIILKFFNSFSEKILELLL